MPTNNTHGQPASFRANILDPTAANAQAVTAAQARVRERGKGATPDFSEITELWADMPMFHADEVNDRARMQGLQQEFLEKGLNDPLYMFSQEGRSYINAFNRFKNDPKREEMSRRFSLAQDQLDDNKQVLGNIFVGRGGQIQSAEVGDGITIPMTVQQAYQDKNMNLGATQGTDFVINQNPFEDVTKNLQTTFSQAGRNIYENSSGLGSGHLTNTIKGGNENQVRLLYQNMVDNGAISEADFNGVIAEAARQVYEPGMNDADLSMAARSKAFEIIGSYADAAVNFEDRTRYQSDPVANYNLRAQEARATQGYTAQLYQSPQQTFAKQAGNERMLVAGNSLIGGQFANVYSTTSDADKNPSLLLQNQSLFGTNFSPQNMAFYKGSAENVDDMQYLDMSDPSHVRFFEDMTKQFMIDPSKNVNMYTLVVDQNGQPNNDAARKYTQALENMSLDPSNPQNADQYIQFQNQAASEGLRFGTFADVQGVLMVDDGTIGIGAEGYKIDFLESIGASKMTKSEYQNWYDQLERENPTQAGEFDRGIFSDDVYTFTIRMNTVDDLGMLNHIDQRQGSPYTRVQTNASQAGAYNNRTVKSPWENMTPPSGNSRDALANGFN